MGNKAQKKNKLFASANRTANAMISKETITNKIEARRNGAQISFNPEDVETSQQYRERMATESYANILVGRTNDIACVRRSSGVATPARRRSKGDRRGRMLTNKIPL